MASLVRFMSEGSRHVYEEAKASMCSLDTERVLEALFVIKEAASSGRIDEADKTLLETALGTWIHEKNKLGDFRPWVTKESRRQRSKRQGVLRKLSDDDQKLFESLEASCRKKDDHC